MIKTYTYPKWNARIQLNKNIVRVCKLFNWNIDAKVDCYSGNYVFSLISMLKKKQNVIIKTNICLN